MARIKHIILAIALTWSALTVLQQFAPAIEYARAWDSGQPSPAFATWAGIDAPGTDWVTGCRERWLAISQ